MNICYTLTFAENKRFEFDVDLDSDTSVETGNESLPDWVKLENFRCSHCSLPEGSRRTCPAALSIKPLVETFGDLVSYDTVQATVNIQKSVRIEASMPAQDVVRALAGLLLALSACPVLMKLRPMAHFHLPFASLDHTIFRFLGTYLIAQHIRQLHGEKPNWNLDGLWNIFEEIHAVNKNLADRINAASKEDAMVNSLIALDMFAHAGQMEIQKHLKKLETLFSAYLQQSDEKEADGERKDQKQSGA